MDNTDIKILGLLKENAKISNINIAKEIGLTAPSTLERVRKLEETGVIKGYKTEFNKEMLSYEITVFVAVTLSVRMKSNIDGFIKRIENMPNVIEYYLTSGTYDFFLKVYAKNVNDLREFLLDNLTSLSDISQTETLLILDEKKFGIDFNEMLLNQDEVKKK